MVSPSFVYASHISAPHDMLADDNLSPRTTPRIKHELDRANTAISLKDADYDEELQGLKPSKAGKKCGGLVEEIPAFISYVLFFLSLMGNIVAIVLNIYDYTLPATATMAISSGLETAAAQFKAYDDRMKKNYSQKQKKKAKERKKDLQKIITAKNTVHDIALQDHDRLKTKNQTKIAMLQAKQDQKVARTKVRLNSLEAALNSTLTNHTALHLSLKQLSNNLTRPEQTIDTLKHELDLIMHHYFEPEAQLQTQPVPLSVVLLTDPSSSSSSSRKNKHKD
jgi:hypothetical protein